MIIDRGKEISLLAIVNNICLETITIHVLFIINVDKGNEFDQVRKRAIELIK
jgi:hypothetical protein